MRKPTLAFIVIRIKITVDYPYSVFHLSTTVIKIPVVSQFKFTSTSLFAWEHFLLFLRVQVLASLTYESLLIHIALAYPFF
jgi:hypothetical protein